MSTRWLFAAVCDQRDADDGLVERQDDNRIHLRQPCALKQELRRGVE